MKLMTGELERIYDEVSWPTLMEYPYIYLKGPSKTMKNLSQDNRSSSRDLGPGPFKYEASTTFSDPVCRCGSIRRA
jgi:hypothetical protein